MKKRKRNENIQNGKSRNEGIKNTACNMNLNFDDCLWRVRECARVFSLFLCPHNIFAVWVIPTHVCKCVCVRVWFELNSNWTDTLPRDWVNEIEKEMNKIVGYHRVCNVFISLISIWFVGQNNYTQLQMMNWKLKFLSYIRNCRAKRTNLCAQNLIKHPVCTTPIEPMKLNRNKNDQTNPITHFMK